MSRQIETPPRFTVSMVADNRHLKRAIEYMQALANRDWVKLDLRFNYKNASEFNDVVTFCQNAETRELDQPDIDRMKYLTGKLYTACMVKKVSGFHSYEPDIETMNSIKLLFMSPDQYLGYYDKSLQPLETKQLVIEYTFCSDTKDEVALTPGVQFSLLELLPEPSPEDVYVDGGLMNPKNKGGAFSFKKTKKK